MFISFLQVDTLFQCAFNTQEAKQHGGATYSEKCVSFPHLVYITCT